MHHCPACGRNYPDDLSNCPEDGTLLMADPTVNMRFATDPLIGKVFGDKYRLEERIGEGGMGAVYRATHLLIDRAVAVKVLRSRFVEDEAARVRFQREARAAGRLQHANAVTVTDFGTSSDGSVYIVMELLEGRSLRDWLAREKLLDQTRSVSIMLQVAAAVAAAHEEGIIHRDLKPANIFIQQRKHAPPVVKVLDFGIAKIAADSLEDSDQHSLTLTGVMIGTPRYMSPEQCEGRPLTPASDVYSLGIILYEMLTGTTPFSGSSALAVAMKHSNEIPRKPGELVAGIAPELEAVILKALEKNPLDRPPNGGEFRRELHAVSQELGIDQFNSGSMPSMETLRNAGIESPSGRLVLDMQRLRSNSFSTTEVHRHPETNGLPPAATTIQDTAIDASAPPKKEPIKPVRPRVSRVDVPIRKKSRTAGRLAVSGMLGFIILAIAGVAVWRISGRNTTTNLGSSNTNTAAPAVIGYPPVSAQPSPVSQPSPTPRPSPAASPTATPTERATEKGENKSPSEKEQPKKESKIKSILKKAGRILKSPF